MKNAANTSETKAGYSDAASEIASDCWGHDTAALFLEQTSRAADDYSVGFDAAVADWASDDLTRRAKVAAA